MEVHDVAVGDSPLGKDRARLRAVVRYEAPGVASDEYWFDVPGEHAAELSTSGNAWFACLLPLAARTNEPLRVPLPVDGALLANAERLMHVWAAWYPDCSVVRVDAPRGDGAAASLASPARAAAFFSGGVDSFFTALRCRDTAQPAERGKVDDLITVWGFDVPLDRPDAFARMRERHQVAARELGKQLIDVATNLRGTRWSTAHWSYLAHGAGLASVALALERRFHTAYIAGSGGYRDLHPWGSHCVTDPLFSTMRTAIVYDAGAYLRTEKTALIVENATALRALRVCWESFSDENCGACNKCLRTILTLDVLGALGRCTAFPTKTVDLRRIARMDCSHPFDLREFQDIRKLALSKGRDDVVSAIDHSVTRTRRAMRLEASLAAIRRPFAALRRRPGRNQ